MLHWLLMNWRSERLRTSLSVLMFAAVSALILLFQGIHVGVLRDLHDGPAEMPADLVGLEAGSNLFALSPSSIAQLSRQRAESVAGVRSAEPFAKFPTVVRWNGRITPVTLFAADNFENWPRVTAGAGIAEAGDMLVDSAVMQLHRLQVGDPVNLYGHQFTIAGITSNTASPFAPYIVVSYDGLLDMYFQSDLPVGDGSGEFLSGLWVKFHQDVPPEAVRAALEGIEPGMRWNTPAELGTADAEFGDRLLGPVLYLLNAIAALIGFLAMSVLRFADVQAKHREIGVMRAIGAKPADLVRLFALGGVALAALSALPAVLLAVGMEQLVELWNPMYRPRVLEPLVLLRGFLIVLGAAVLGGMLALRAVFRIDPALVFQR